MAYKKVNWMDYPSSETPVNAENLGIMDDGIAKAHEEIEKIKKTYENIANLVFPIGTIIMSVSNQNPGDVLGGEWTAWGSGRVPMGVDGSNADFNTAEKKGGNSSYDRATFLSNHSHRFSARGSISKSTLEASAGGANANISVVAATATGTIDPHRHQNDTRTLYDFEAEGVGIVGGSTVRTCISVSNNKIPRYTEYTQPGFYGAPHTHDIYQTAHEHTVTVKDHNHVFSGTITDTNETGKTGDVKILPPYETCFMWKRIG